MKPAARPNQFRGMTLVEVILVLALIGLFAMMIFPLRKISCGGSIIRLRKCQNNLEQIGYAYANFANDNDGHFPYEATNSPAFHNDWRAWRHYAAMSNELGSGQELTCPADRAWTNFTTSYSNATEVGSILRQHGNDALSYFVGLDASVDLPGAILAGDWHIETSVRRRNLLLTLGTNDSVAWTYQVHAQSGNILLSDGSARRVSPHSSFSNSFQALLRASPLPTNRWLLPR